MAHTRNELFESSLEQLEYERILEHIARYTASSLGVEHLAQAVPLEDIDAISRELRMVGEAREILSEGLEIPLIGLYDIRQALSLSTVSGAYLGGEDLRAVLSTIQGFRKIREFFSSRDEDAPLLYELAGGIHENKLLERHISDAIDDSGNVKDTASRDLFQIRRDIVAKSGALRERLQKILRRVAEDELLSEEFVTLREGRLVLPVRVEYKRKIPGIIHGESNTGATVYLEPAEIFDMNNEIAELTFAERREVERILKTLTQEVGSESANFREAVWRVQLVDSVTARARYAEEFNCVEPTITDQPVLKLTNAYHPLLQVRLPQVVPMAVDLHSDSRCIIISGPNAGGKTIAIKTLGLVTMMALAGIHPPADECVVHPCALFSDIGDRQSVENDLSTFSAHMTRVHQILHEVKAGDIILLDELGTGTDPDEGAAIAAAILDRLLERGGIVLATTHHSALKVYAYDTDGVVNAGMEFDTDSLAPTYRLKVGVPGNSYAFELLDRFGYEGELIAAARARLGDDRNAMSDIIQQLENSLAEGRRLELKRADELRQAEELRTKYEAENAQLREKKQGILEKSRDEAKAVLAGANSMIENTLREIRSGATNESVREMRRAIEESRKTLDERPEKEAAGHPSGLGKGDNVRLRDGSEIGELEFDPDEDGNVIVQFGALRMRSNIADLEKVSGKEKRKAERVSRSPVTNAEVAQTRLDLRGKYADEAGVEIEQALTAALNSGLMRMEIIHGKGTGALRKKTHEVLRGHPHVDAFRLGALTEGGAGVTIVELK